MAVADPKDAERTGFQNPFEVTSPPDCEGWGEMYAPHVLFGEDRRAFEESRFWFQDGLHAAEPLYPFDALPFDYAVVALNQANARLFAVPPSLGTEYRLLNGYVYLSPNSVTDEATLAQRGRAVRAARRLLLRDTGTSSTSAGCKRSRPPRATSRARGARSCPSSRTRSSSRGSRPRLEPRAPARLRPPARGTRPHLPLPLRVPEPRLRGVPRLLRALPAAFPGHRRDRRIAKMLPGSTFSSCARTTSSDGSRGSRSSSGVAEAVKRAAGRASELRALSRAADRGERWLADYEETKDPWFYFSSGTGVFHHHHRSWIDDPTLPIATIGSYIERTRGRRGHLSPSARLIAERERRSPRSTARCSPKSSSRHSTRASRSRARSSPTSRTTTSTSTTATSRSSGTRCASSGRSSPSTGSSQTAKTSSTCATTRFAPRSRSSGSTGARAAPGSPAAPPSGRRSSSGGRRSTRRCDGGRRLRRSARCPRTSPTRHDHALGDHRRSASRLALVRRRSTAGH